jgi:hypothetical protein
MEKEYILPLINMYIKANSNMIKCTEKELSIIKMVLFLKDFLKIIKFMALES